MTEQIDIRFHPLVVMTIADHYTRSNLQDNKTKVLGCLLGQQNGRVVSVLEAFEIGFNEDASGNISLDQERIETFETDMELFRETYPYEMLGWYTTGSTIGDDDKQIHQQMLKYNDRPLLALLNPNIEDGQKDLPLTVYAQRIQTVNERTVAEFTPLPTNITPDEAESVTMVHCAKTYSTEVKDQSVVVPHNMALAKALQHFKTRVGMIRKYLIDSKKSRPGGLQEGKDSQSMADQDILRQIKGLCNLLPAMDSDQFKTELCSEYNDSLLVTYLASITKGLSEAVDVVQKFNSANVETILEGMDNDRMQGRDYRDRDDMLMMDSHGGMDVGRSMWR